MPSRLFHLALIGAVLAPASGLCTPDRHAGIYEFQRLPPGFCARPENQRSLPQQQGPLLRNLGDLPPAYVIWINAPSASGAPPNAFTGVPAPSAAGLPFNPCAGTTPALVRVR